MRQQSLGVDLTSADENQLVISYTLLRQVVGWIGTLLPIVLLAGLAISSTQSRPDSMSGYYYTDMRNVFVGALCALGAFLGAYDGYDDLDRWITNIAGFCAVGVAFCRRSRGLRAGCARLPGLRSRSCPRPAGGW